MALSFQGSLLDDGQALGHQPLSGALSRTKLAHGAWIDVLHGWVQGADDLFIALAEQVAWQAERRQMYDREVDVPRLVSFHADEEPLPHPALTQLRNALSQHYAPELGEPFTTAGLCLYRDGRDSVAWHGDTIGRSSTEDTMVAIVSLGAPRALLLRPRTGPGYGSGAPQRHLLGHGDLIVMGGSCQRTWLHAVPKTAKACGPRISVQFRPRGVR